MADSPLDLSAGLTPQRTSGASMLETPSATQPLKVNWPRSVVVAFVHLLALAALCPWFFSWTGLVLMIGGHFVFGLGIALGYHRLLTHRALECPRQFERLVVTLGVCCLQDTPARWVATHRMHHQHSDKQDDPHTPRVGFLWSHLGWLFYENRDHLSLASCDRLARDILRDPYYFWLERGVNGLLVYVLHALCFLLGGFAVGWISGGGWIAGIQFGLSLLVWGVLLRTVVVWHGTWAVNSITHIYGYRNYETRECSRNNWFVALFSHGEGWHNNHHASPRSANNRHRWWEFDFTFQVIRLLRAMGLANNVVVRTATSNDAD